MSTLEERIEQASARLADLKARQQARVAREKARKLRLARKHRTRALVLWGVALEREAKSTKDASSIIRQLIHKHLARTNEREAALAFLDEIAGSVDDERLYNN